jgi:uncharacterized OsmC-like protein
MLNRFPHSATIKVQTEKDDDDDGLNGTDDQLIAVEGRYEPEGMNKSLNYSARFYCPILDILKENPLALNGQKLLINGSSIGISQAWNYQTHAELWLD